MYFLVHDLTRTGLSCIFFESFFVHASCTSCFVI
ncbi:unnamed protein product [Spirodela intermedia]|uniref:Uncharacterized protein n=1 Tax=Spirodela intermedia TaxID=51605 RepID=A0A7I8IWM6_SPIIN|nr:unnamed protein product [Spirodela intermedia]CAA6662379.1 unnamed protein product [Spirodela intermedia]